VPVVSARRVSSVGRQEAVVGRCLTGSGLIVGVLLWLAVRYAYRPWMGLFSIVLDVTLWSAQAWPSSLR
jgi:hypothetical protein